MQLLLAIITCISILSLSLCALDTFQNPKSRHKKVLAIAIIFHQAIAESPTIKGQIWYHTLFIRSVWDLYNGMLVKVKSWWPINEEREGLTNWTSAKY